MIENPRGQHHYLNRYWPLKPSLIDKNRRLDGDYYRKPTQYWFIGFEPENNILGDPIPVQISCAAIVDVNGKNNVFGVPRKVARNMISPIYANRFIRKYLIESEDAK